MHSIQVHDRRFVPAIPDEEIKARIQTLAEQMRRDYADLNPVFIGVLNGAFLFAADLLRELAMDCRISFVKLASYNGTGSSGTVKTLLGLNEQLKGEHVIVLEDIVDTGLTLRHILDVLQEQEPASLRVAALLYKPGAVQVPLPVDYVGFEVGNEFLVGYGLDYNGFGRNLKDIYQLKNA